MTEETRNRAIKSLLEKLSMSVGGYHFDRIFVVGDKLFYFELPADTPLKQQASGRR